ncbi:hypothetical protein DS258_20540 [Salmonella enterica subsp. enterica]|nr:hypothetical protein [Salmonella enterica subsp. enterica serovar Typhimurium]
MTEQKRPVLTLKRKTDGEAPARSRKTIINVTTPFACGVREALFEDASRRGIPLSHKKIIRALKAIARSEAYLSAMKAGACRYDTEGYVTEHITVEEEQYALARLAKVRAQNARKAELRAVLAQTV